MRFTPSLRVLGMVVALAFMIAGCGTSSDSTASAAPTATATTAATATTPPTAATGDLPVNTAVVQPSGKTVLVTAKGITLYYRTSDTATNVFHGSAWPPLLAGSGAPTSSTTLPGKLAVLNDANGAQVTYNGHPLYTFAGDANTPGKATGDGIGGVWFFAVPNLGQASFASAPPVAASPTPDATHCTGYYCS